jgi:hypothetical protein
MALRSTRRPLNEAPGPVSSPTPAEPPPPTSTGVRPHGYVAPSRHGRAQVVCFVDRATKRQLDTLAFEQERTLQSLCLEAIDLLFQAHGRPRTAVEGAADAPAALPKIGR